jgi:uncharacterized membrane protein YfcA
MIIILSLIGIIIGILSGLTGLGGGIILIPSLLGWFHYQGFFVNNGMQIAANTSIAILFFTTLSTSYQYYKNQLINWQMVKSFLPGLLIGIGCGSFVVTFLDSSALQKSFGLFLLVIVLHLLWPKKPSIKTHKSPIYIIYLAGICTGVLAPMFGIGGGILMIPFFHAQGLILLEAIGSSVFCLLPIAMISLISNTVFGYLKHHLPLESFNTIGYLYWPALLLIAPMSMLFTPIGAEIAKKTNVLIIKRLLALVIFLTAIQLLMG